jgi:outer membrane murein-binding lipoprotein Lpp
MRKHLMVLAALLCGSLALSGCHWALPDSVPPVTDTASSQGP